MTLTLFLDTETSGLDPLIHTPWEVAWQLYDHVTIDGRSHLHAKTPPRVWQVPLTPAQLAIADPTGLAVGRYASRVGRGPTTSPAEVLAMLRHDLRTAGWTKPTDVTLVGACPWFDDQMLARWWGGSVNDRPWHYHLVDIETLIAGAVTPPAVAPWRYSDLLARIGVYVDPDSAHTAAGDVATLVEAYAAVYRATITTAGVPR